MTAVREGRDLDFPAWGGEGGRGCARNPRAAVWPRNRRPRPEEPLHALGDSPGERDLAAVLPDVLSDTHARLEYP